jgi:4-amino-4-deoxy-L-arabinose transferase-like glycosyltransferase
MDPDEGRYAEIAREMLASGDWLVPRLNLVPYLEKPPLVYWLTALSFRVFGLTEWAARLPAALSALGGVLLAFGLGRQVWGAGPGFWGGLVLATSLGFVGLGRLLTLDMTLTFFLNLGVGLGFLAYVQNRRELLGWAYFSLALGALAKGPVAPVLAGLIWGVFILWDGRRRLTFWLHPAGMAWFAVLTIPWFLFMSLTHPEFARFFFWEHHVGRFATSPIHARPVYFYLPVLAAFLLPWTFLLPWALGQVRPWTETTGRFLIIWAGMVLVFFSCSRGKLPPYVLPALLPLALLLGRALAAGGWTRGLKAGLWTWLVVGLGLGGLYLFLPAPWAAEMGKIPGIRSYVAAPLVVFALTPVAALVSGRLTAVAWGALGLTLLLPGAISLISQYRSPREAGQAAAARWQPGAGLVGLGRYSQGLSFYVRQPMHLLGVRTELDFGLSLEPASGLALRSLEDIQQLSRSRPQVFVLVEGNRLPELTARLPGRWEVLARYKDCLLVAIAGK